MSVSSATDAPLSPRTLAKGPSGLQPLQEGVNRVQLKAIPETSQFLTPQPVQTHAVGPTESPKVSQAVQGVLKASTLSFEHVLDSLKRHVLELPNPHLRAYIHEKLQTFCDVPLDPSNQTELTPFFDDPKLPLDTQKMLKQFLIAMLADVRSYKDAQAMCNVILKLKEELRELNQQLKLSTQPALEDFAEWKELGILFKISAFLALQDRDYRKLWILIEQENIDQLREFIEELSKANLFNRLQAEDDLKKLAYEEDLNTLLSEVINTKPQKKEGIITYWNHPESFFVNKTVYLMDLPGDSYQGTILQCVRTVKGLFFHMHDGSVVCISPAFSVYHEKCHRLHKLWTAILNGSFRVGDEFTLERSSETDNKDAMQPGIYRLANPKNYKGTGVLGSGYLTGGDYFECEFTAVNGSKRYILRGEYCEGEIHQIRITGLGRTVTVSVHHFELMHPVTKKERKDLDGINRDNAESRVLIREESNHEKIRLQLLENLKQQLDALRGELLSKDKRPLLLTLVDNFIQNNLQGIDFALLNTLCQEIAATLKNISRQYDEHLSLQQPPEVLLKDLVLEANYALYVKKHDGISISKTLALFNEADLYLQKMRGQEMTFFLGNTGAGKSASIGFLMGARFTEFTNSVGEKVVQHAEGTTKDTYPIVGQSVGTSETLHAQGFPVDENYQLVDFSGFNDTFGISHELCTNLSIDRLVEFARNIRSLVVVIPANAFLIDRGNYIIELISTIKERFPASFTVDPTQSNPRVYLLITKRNQLQNEAIKKLRDGTRINELVRETEGQVRTLMDQGLQFEDFEVQSLRRRNEIWRALQHMWKEQVHILDTQNNVQRRALLKLYSAPGFATKGRYLKALSGEFLQRKFGNCIGTAADTWGLHLFEQYLYALPENVGICSRILSEKRKRLEDLQLTRQDRMERVEKLGKEAQSLGGSLKVLKENENNLGDEQLRKQLLEQVSKLKNESLDEARTARITLEASLERALELSRGMDREIEKLEEIVANTLNHIRNLKAEIGDFKIGTKTTTLFEKICDPEEILTLVGWNSEKARNGAYLRLGSTEGDYDPQKKITVKAKDYNGSTSQLVVIEKDFRLVPEDANKRKEFTSSLEKSFLNKPDEVNDKAFISSRRGSGYKAQVEGFGYQIDLRCRPAEDGKKVAYGFKLSFKPGQPLPWIRIVHSIPRAELYAPHIKDLEGEIGLYEAKLRTSAERLGDPQLRGIKKDKLTLEQEINAKKEEVTSIKSKIKQLEDTQVRERIQDLIHEIPDQINQVLQEKTQLENFAEIDEKIKVVRTEISEQETRLASLRLDQRNIALIIATQWQSAKLLRSFADILCAPDFPQDSFAMNSWQKFIRLFDQNKDTLLAKIETEHGF